MILFFRHSFLTLLVTTAVVCIFLVSGSTNVLAQSSSLNSGIATIHIIVGGSSSSGDIVSFDRRSQTFHLTRIPGDKDAFGIVIKDPVLLLSNGNAGTPIITNGEVSVNVTTKNGPIRIGDYISPSSIAGKGARAVNSDPYIIGTALSSFSGSASSTASSTDKIRSGSIQMFFLHRINPLASVDQKIPRSVEIGKNIIFHIMKYILATLVAIGTVYIAFKVSNSSIKEGLISIGRNPLAKTSINSMLAINVIMIILISAVGLTVAIALVLLPI